MKIFNNFYIPIILISIAIAVVSNFGAIISIIEPLTFTNIIITNQGFVSMSSFNQTFFIDNQWWRLISPMFIHFSFAHLAFNCLWVYILGEKIEKINGSLIFMILVLISSSENVEIELFDGPSDNAKICVDGQNDVDLPYGVKIHISKMEKTLKLVHPQDNDFFEACREKLGWSLNISKN